MQEEAVRKLIKEIRAKADLSEFEKCHQIQEIMMKSHNDERLNLLASPLPPNNSKTCEHYEKKCYKFYFECCKVYDPCVRCHRERKTCELEKFNVSRITCTRCGTEQAPSSTCTNCLQPFSESYCSICNIWSGKLITHCNDCGLCRVGKQDEIFHCHTCGACFQSLHREKHECTPNLTEICCIVCKEHVCQSRERTLKLLCNHFIHEPCVQRLVENEYYRCPQCRKSLGDMSEHWQYIRQHIQDTPMPKEILPILPQDIVSSPFGRFQANSKQELIQPSSDLSSSGSANSESPAVTKKTILWEGILVDWELSTKKPAKAILNENCLQKVKYAAIVCNDCGHKSSVKFHYYGLECKYCGSFNTQE